MTRRRATVRLEGDGLRLVAATGSGHLVAMDSAEGNTAARPAELLVVALAGCTAMDVVSILRKKGQVIASYEVEVDGDQRDTSHPHAFERFDIRHVVTGEVSEAALRRSIELSATRFCTVTSNLASGLAEIHHGYRLRAIDGEEVEGEVVVTGPYEAPDELGVRFQSLDREPAGLGARA